METYILICLDGFKWIVQKAYADLLVNQHSEGMQVTNIAGVFNAPCNGKYWESFESFLGTYGQVPAFKWVNMPDSVAREISDGLGMNRETVNELLEAQGFPQPRVTY